MKNVELKEKTYNRIKEVLDERGIKQTWLAEKLGKTYRSINLYVNNEVQAPIPVLYEIANILGVKPIELLNNKLNINE